jgi:hypothetical protein
VVSESHFLRTVTEVCGGRGGLAKAHYCRRVLPGVPPHVAIRVTAIGITIAIQLLLGWSAAVADDDLRDRASFGEWVVLAIVTAGAVAVFVFNIVRRRRDVNPHTGLTPRISAKRARGPLRRPQRGA